MMFPGPPGSVGIRKGVLVPKIYRVYTGSPADTAGLKPGDLILQASDDKGKKCDITGAPGTYVNLLVQRGDKSILNFRIKRNEEQDGTREGRSLDKVYIDALLEDDVDNHAKH